MHGVSWGRWGKVNQMTFFCLWLTGMKAKQLMIKGASFSFPCSNGKVRIMGLMIKGHHFPFFPVLMGK